VIRRLSSRLDAIVEQCAPPDGPGCTVVVVYRGELVHVAARGLADLEHRVPLTTRTVFHLASVSKHVTAFAVALLAERGALGLDDLLERHLPGSLRAAGRTTMRQCLGHTSGIREFLQLLMVAGWRIDDVITDGDALAVIGRQRDLAFAPGTEYSYSNSGYLLAGQVVGAASGRSLRSFLEEELFSPLGMGSTHVHDDYTELVPDGARSYKVDARGAVRQAVMSFGLTGSTGLRSSAEDLARWLANLQSPSVGGEVLPRLLEPGRLADGTPTGYGLGLVCDTVRGRRRAHHGGEDAGFTSYLAHYPDDAIGIAVLCNGRNLLAPAVAERVEGACLEELAGATRDGEGAAAPLLPPAMPLLRRSPSPTPARRLTPGRYADRATGLAVSVDPGGALVVGEGWDPVPLEPAADGTFAARGVGLRVAALRRGPEPAIRLAGYGSSVFDLEAVAEVPANASPRGGDDDDVNGLCGTYRSAELRAELVVRREDDRIVLDACKLVPTTLRPVLPDCYTGTWGDSEIGWPFAWRVIRPAASPDGEVAGALLTMDRARAMRFERVDGAGALRDGQAGGGSY
jgi:CubicO group peptidase (beta-lactamase class C family)